MGLPVNEFMFTDPENRVILENAFLLKGIEILENSNETNKCIRPFGLSLPSFEDLGFGTLSFTWRNIPQNSPLVFWYSGGGYTPLFDVSRS